MYERLQAKKPRRDYLRATALTTHTISHTHKLCALSVLVSHNSFTLSFIVFPFSLLPVFPLLCPLPSASICFSSICFLSQQHPLSRPPSGSLSHPPTLHLSSPFFPLHPFQPFSIFTFCPCSLAFFPLSSLLLCRCTAVQRQISVLVPVRQRHGKLHAKTQSANADKGGGVRTSVHTKHQTHLNHKMK